MGRSTPKKQNSNTQQQSSSSPARSPAPKPSQPDAHQKRLESLLAEFARLRRNWNALVLVDGLKLAHKIVRGRQEALCVRLLQPGLVDQFPE